MLPSLRPLQCVAHGTHAGEQTRVLPGDLFETRLAQKLRTQISPSRIPHAAPPVASPAAESTPTVALKPAAENSDGSPRQRHGQHHHDRHQTTSEPQQEQQHRLSLPQVQQRQRAGQLSPHQQQAVRHAQSSPACEHQQPQPQRWPNHSRTRLQAAAAISGCAASQKLHEFLLHQQHKQEQYWLSKYGKLLAPTAKNHASTLRWVLQANMQPVCFWLSRLAPW